MSRRPSFAAFEARESAADHVAALFEGGLRTQLQVFGHAGILVSGGSTPGPVFDRLSNADLPWDDKVCVGLVDERWVDEDDGRSNTRLVKQSLLQRHATAAEFIAMKTTAPTPDAAVLEVSEAYERFDDLGPLILLGMGSDGHTASWFPGSKGLDAAMDPNGPNRVEAIDATGAPIAGDMPLRMTITAGLLNAASMAILFITGEEKRAVLENRSANLPVHHAERLLGDRLVEVWAP
ncbi:MAG: 6-phosphogluconolactonase [Pseudomonadota bacterium]